MLVWLLLRQNSWRTGGKAQCQVKGSPTGRMTGIHYAQICMLQMFSSIFSFNIHGLIIEQSWEVQMTCPSLYSKEESGSGFKLKAWHEMGYEIKRGHNQVKWTNNMILAWTLFLLQKMVVSSVFLGRLTMALSTNWSHKIWQWSYLESKI